MLTKKGFAVLGGVDLALAALNALLIITENTDSLALTTGCAVGAACLSGLCFGMAASNESEYQ